MITQEQAKTVRARHIFHDVRIDIMEFVTMVGLTNLMYSIEIIGKHGSNSLLFHGLFRLFDYREWMILFGGLVGSQVFAVLMGWRQVRKALCFLICIVLGIVSLLVYQYSLVGLAWRYEAIFSFIALIAHVRLARRVRF